MKNMVNHDLVLLVSFFGVTVDKFSEFKGGKDIELPKSLTMWVPGTSVPYATYTTNFSRVSFTVAMKSGFSICVTVSYSGGKVSHTPFKDATNKDTAKYFPIAYSQSKEIRSMLFF